MYPADFDDSYTFPQALPALFKLNILTTINWTALTSDPDIHVPLRIPGVFIHHQTQLSGEYFTSWTSGWRLLSFAAALNDFFQY